MTSTSRAYFEDMYRDTDDPWDFETSAYEKRKYAADAGLSSQGALPTCFRTRMFDRRPHGPPAPTL